MKSYELKALGPEEAMEYAIDNHQDRMCELCELYVLGCKHMTSTFICEGSKCDVAIDYIMEELIENAEADEEAYVEKFKPILTKRK